MRLPNIIKNQFKCWRTTKNLIERIDIILSFICNCCLTGSRSKDNIMVVTLLSSAMRWGIRDTGKRFTKKDIETLK